MFRLSAFLFLLLLVAPTLAAEGELSQQHLDFFESKVRPLLVKYCYECHSAKADDAQGGLLLDSKAGWSKGGDSGPAIVPGKPEESLFVQAIQYDEIEMPPDGRLTEAEVEILTTWVKIGAPDPRDQEAEGVVKPKRFIDLEEGRKFWAFQPPIKHAPPTVQNNDWPTTTIDRFILAKLEANNLEPSVDAKRQQWLRRVTFDLSGLPPTLAEIEAFLNDRSPLAHERVVNRLLTSPRFGETWGRYWLDVARYADSNGSDFNATFHNAWRYRDYVIESFNADRRYDEFIKQQLAGDLQEYETQSQYSEQAIASGFLLLGPKMLSERDKAKLRMDVVDEQVDSVGRAFLGLTLGCARCHDHKFDPIPTTDYYAMAGIFRSTESLYGESQQYVSTWREHALPIEPAHKAALDAHAATTKTLQEKIKTAKQQLAALGQPQRPGVVLDNPQAKLVGVWKESKFSPNYLGVGYIHDDKLYKGELSATFTATIPADGKYEVRLSYTPGDNREKNVPVTIQHADGESNVMLNQQPKPAIDNLFQPVGRFRFSKAKPAAVVISNKNTTGYVLVDAVWFFPLNEESQGPSSEEFAKLTAAKTKAEAAIKSLEAELKKHKANAPPPAPMAMAARDHEDIGDSHIHIRGEIHAIGERVDRGFLQVMHPSDWQANNNQSGRLALADWVASNNNPLTARVMVNRIWSRLLGKGIVATVDNFGNLGARPTHAELLDRLAIEFMEDGWSTKSVVRKIVLSRVYRVSSHASEVLVDGDPENKWLGRFNRRRLPVEAIRDAILAASNQLDLSTGGSPVEGYGTLVVDNNNASAGGRKEKTHLQRTVYLPIIRNDLPDMLTIFDFADPDVVMGKRTLTTSPAQALFLMNNPLIEEHARRLAENELQKSGDGEIIDRIFLQLMTRKPTTTEREHVAKFVENFVANRGKSDEAAREAWSIVCHTLISTAEFRMLN